MYRIYYYVDVYKRQELGQLPGYNRQSQETRHTLLSLNIADDYFKAKRQAEMLEEELEAKDREMYDLKHDLINKQVELDEAKEKAQERIQELLQKAAELEKELDELLK